MDVVEGRVRLDVEGRVRLDGREERLFRGGGEQCVGATEARLGGTLIAILNLSSRKLILKELQKVDSRRIQESLLKENSRKLILGEFVKVDSKRKEELTVKMNGFGEEGEAKNCSTKGARVLCSGSSRCCESSRASSRLKFAFTRGARPSGRTCCHCLLRV